MRLRVRHRTRYRFDQPQARLVQLLRLTPRNGPGQSIVSWDIEVDRDARLKPARDGYGNRITTLYVDGPVEEITIAVRGEVLTEDRAGVLGDARETLPAAAFLQPTALTHADPAVLEFVAGLDLPDDPIARAHRLNLGVHERLAAVDAVIGVDQRAAARLADGEGDPQGMTHLLIAAARAAGLPARYVSGHLFRPEEGEGHAAHGWAELHLPGFGWVGFDPTLGACPAERHVRVAVGLDHAQAAPVSGARFGGGGEWLAVDVAVRPAQPA